MCREIVLQVCFARLTHLCSCCCGACTQRIELEKATRDTVPRIGLDRHRESITGKPAAGDEANNAAGGAAGTGAAAGAASALGATTLPTKPSSAMAATPGALTRASSAAANTTTTGEAAVTEEQQALTKEEEEFLKLEAAFITELGLDNEHLPAFAK